MPLLRITNLRKALGGKSVLNGISLSVGKGEACTVIGPSGGGKSTLLKCINLLLPMDAGTIYLQDTPVAEASGNGQIKLTVEPANLRRHIGMVFQDWNLWPNLTIRQNIALAPRRVLGISRAEANELAAEWGRRVLIADHLDVYPHHLSGGQKQRAAIARALAMNPDILMLDEITSALDPVLAAEILDLTASLKGEGRTLVVVSHHIEFARAISDRVVFLYGGHIHEEGDAGILDTPKTAELQWFLQRLRRAH